MMPAAIRCSWLARVAPRCCGGLIVTIGALVLCSPFLFAQNGDSTTRLDSPTQWQATTDVKSDDLLPQRLPVRIIESHSQQGDHALDKRTVEVRGTDGKLETYQEIEKETVTIDNSTVRTTTRTFGRDVNGRRTLLQVTEQEKRSSPGGDSTVLRATSNPDLNGKLQVVQREIVETKIVGQDLQETNTTVMLSNIEGGLAPVSRTQEVLKQRPDGMTESEKTTMLADGAGKWELNETRRSTTTPEGPQRTAEERVYRRDAEGKLIEVSRMVAKESDYGSDQANESAEIYSVDVPGTTRDGNLHLVERTTTGLQTRATGERVTEKRVEQINPGDPTAGLRVSILINNETAQVPAGEQSTTTIRSRDSNGSFGIVSVDATTSDSALTIQMH